MTVPKGAWKILSNSGILQIFAKIFKGSPIDFKVIYAMPTAWELKACRVRTFDFILQPIN